MTYTQENRALAINTPLGDNVLLLRSLTGTEAISKLFQFELELASESDAISFDALAGKSVTFRINDANGNPRYFNGVVRSLKQGVRDVFFTAYRMQVVPWFWFLTQTSDCRIFSFKKTPEIIEEIFSESNFRDYEFRLSGDFTQREYCVQYCETDFAFISRLLEEEGIYYFFEHYDGKHVLVLANNSGAHRALPGFATIRFASAANPTEDVIRDLEVEQNFQAGSFAFQDYNFEMPSLDLNTNIVGSNGSEHFEYPGRFMKRAEGESRVSVRLEEQEIRRVSIQGRGGCRGLASGAKFKLRDHYRNELNRDYLITSVIHESSQAGNFTGNTIADAVFDHKSRFECMRLSTPFRPSRLTPKPFIRGTQTAVIVGKSGEEIWTDHYGRVKVQFHWDRYGKGDENSSCWIRVSQAWAGKNWGAMVLPRMGQEVVVSFLDGDPDRPLITGSVYNAEQLPPYDLPAEQTKSTFKTESSKGGSGFNELRFEDAKGKEQVFIHAERNQDVRVKKNLYETVGEETHRSVGKNYFEQVGGDSHLSIKGDQNQSVQGTLSLKAGSNLEAQVGSTYALDAGTEIHLKAGTNLVIESGASLTLKVGGNFINLNSGGIFISGTMVMINSGGSAGSGSGASPQAPQPPTLADTAISGGQAIQPKAKRPPKPIVYSPAAIVLKQAATSGTPFCAVCERMRQGGQ